MASKRAPRPAARRAGPGVVIVGNSVAAIAALEAFRAVDATTPLTVVTREKLPAYSRPLIMSVEGDLTKLYYRDRAFYRKHRVTVIHAAATAISPKTKTVALAGGKQLRYGKLLLTVGGAPVIPKFAVTAPDKLFTFTTLADAQRLVVAARGKRNAVVIGCGMIGIKAAEFLRGLRLGVTIVELQDKPFAGVLDAAAGELVARRLREHVTLVLGESVTAVGPDGVRLSGGRELPADLVIAAVGVVPDLALARGAGLKVRRGIVVDDRMRTSAKDIFAAGDCVEALDILAGVKRPLPVWPLASRQGRVAGSNLAGKAATYAGGFMLNSVDVFGLPLITLGLSTAADGEIFTVNRPETLTYKKIIVRDQRVIGAIFVNDIDRAGIITGLIRDRVDVTTFKADLLNDDFGYIHVPKEFRSREVAPVEI